VTPTEGERFFVAGYHAYWTGASWEEYPWDALQRLYLFEIEVGADGSLSDRHGWPEEWSGLLGRARDAGVSLVPTISMHDADAFVELFASPERAARLVVELTALLAASPDLDGLHLDFEVFRPVDLVVRDGYTAFVARLDRALDSLDPTLSLSVFAMAFDDDDVYNERALAELADYLVVQGYDFHPAAGPRAGPLGATEGWGRLNWTSVLDRFLGYGVPARKIVMAVPLYGYEWPVVGPDPGAATRGEAVIIPLAPAADVVPELPRARARALEHGPRRDSESGVPYYVYQDTSGWRQGWFEDGESLRTKYAFVRERGLGGIALFPLAYGDASLWEELRPAFSLPRGRTPPDMPR
jgi:spore germination protein YaaH